MPRQADPNRMSPNQREGAKRTLDELLARADTIPTVLPVRQPIDILPLVRKLRDEKRLSWDEIYFWLYENTEFKRSGTFWRNLYTENQHRLQDKPLA